MLFACFSHAFCATSAHASIPLIILFFSPLLHSPPNLLVCFCLHLQKEALFVKSVFECQKCGHCCSGRGGIVLARRDIERLAAWLKMDAADMLSQYAENMGGKPRLRPGQDGFCIFFRAACGCSIHPAKPDVCRAWPFFRGNLADKLSLDMAREYCPGIRKDADHAEFVRQGLTFLVAEKLICDDSDADAPNALKAGSLLMDIQGEKDGSPRAPDQSA